MADSKETKEVAKSENVDEELSNLLDSALEDFGKELKQDNKIVEKAEPSDVGEASAEMLDMEKIMKEFETNMLPLLMNADNMSAEEENTFKKMTESARQVLLNPGEDSTAFGTFLAEGLQASQNDQMPNLHMPPEELMKAFADSPEQGEFLHFMRNVMHAVLRKDMIYPGMKHIADQFPAWLETNRERLSAEEVERYEKQLSLIQQVCAVMEPEQESDGTEVRVQRMEQVIDLMQKLQECGDVPKDLVEGMEPGPVPNLQDLNLDQLQNVGSGDQQCSVM